MANPNENIRDAFIQRQVQLGRFTAAEVAKITALIRRVDADVVARLAGLEPGQSAAYLESFLNELRSVYTEIYRGYGADFTQSMGSLAATEAAFAGNTLDRAAQLAGINAAIQRPTPDQIRAAAFSRPFQGKLLREWLSGLEEGTASRVRDQIRIGYVEGESIDRIVRRIRGTRAAGYRDGVMEISRRGAEAMVRTAVTHTAQSARNSVFEANSDIVQGELYNAVLDARTTPRCQTLDGKVFPLGKGPRPPQHINCRSFTTVVLKGFPPPERTSYSEWLRRQSPATQDDILGKTKGELFRDGKLPLDRFVDQNGKPITLDRLRDLEPQAFERAGL